MNFINAINYLKTANRRIISKLSVILLGLYVLQGCTGEPISSSTLAAASLATVVLEDKLPSDYIAEWTTGMDCSWIRQQEDKGALCRPPHPAKVVEAPLYCVKTIGGRDCYREKPKHQEYQIY